MTILLNATTTTAEPIMIAVAVIAFSVLIFLSIKGKLRDWFLR